MLTRISWQLRTIGHTCTGSCICHKKENGRFEVNPECTLAGHSGPVRCVAFSPDGTRIVSGSREHVKIWDVETGTEVSTFERAHKGWRGDGCVSFMFMVALA